MLLKPIAPVETPAPHTRFQPEIVPFADLSSLAADLAEVDLFITPLIGTGFDAFDLLHHLGRVKFHGRLRVLTKRLPDRAVVLQDLRSVGDPLGIKVELREYS